MDPQSIINQLFMQHLGRQPTPAELTGFASAIQSGVLDPTGLSLFIQGSSQYQQSQVPGAVQGFANQLQQGNAQTLQMGFDKAQQQFAQQGRPNSSGLASAFADVAGNLAGEQSPQIAQYYGQLQQNALNPNQYANQYFGNQRNFQNNNFAADQAIQSNNWYQQALGQNMKQAQQNNWFQLGGAALGGISSGVGLGAGKKLFS